MSYGLGLSGHLPPSFNLKYGRGDPANTVTATSTVTSTGSYVQAIAEFT